MKNILQFTKTVYVMDNQSCGRIFIYDRKQKLVKLV